ncbi:hypothetical protein NEMBOFW57_008855 [Staphylotrichum longicolle]|uniref:Phytanoyl-CoA dioxygenase n=1 Tax=Staphylotrichum longicolle TaxID=669026 RepID=A0AAD4ES58_9PEZI|nr:hypothetical protein NEMBOFW57_008855 [Staphylotrichum longicolle]
MPPTTTTTTTTTTTHHPPPSPDPHPHLTALRRDGFLIIPSLLTPPELAALRAAAAHITAVARTGAWPHVRTVGKQFPPWDASLVPARAGIWGVQHLLHPDLPVSREERDAFVRLYFDGRLLGVAREVLGISSDQDQDDDDDDDDGDDGGDMTMELMNMLVRPDPDPTKKEEGGGAGGGPGFALRWHRDDIPASATAEEERARLKTPGEAYVHTQWNLPLFDDASLVVVPGSHARPRTDAERSAGEYEDHLEGQVTVALRAGDVVFYDNNILHRGVYDGDKERMTLHGRAVFEF